MCVSASRSDSTMTRAAALQSAMQRCRRSALPASISSSLRNQATDLPGGVASSTISRSAVSRRPHR